MVGGHASTGPRGSKRRTPPIGQFRPFGRGHGVSAGASGATSKRMDGAPPRPGPASVLDAETLAYAASPALLARRAST